MKVLFAVSNEEVSENIVKRYQREYKEIISYKNVYYFNAILKELQKDKTYDRVVISEDLEAFTHNQYDQIDKFIFDKLDSISDEASNFKGDDIPIILICSDRRTKSEQMLIKLFGIGIYNALLGTDRTVEELCKLIHQPRLKKEGKAYYKIDVEDVNYKAENENDVSEVEIQNILAHYKRLGKNEEKYLESFENIAAQYNDTQLRIIAKFLPLNVRAVLEERSPKYQKVMAFNAKVTDKLRQSKNAGKAEGTTEKLLKTNHMRDTVLSTPVVIPNAVNIQKGKRLTKVRQEEPEQESIKQIEQEINTYVKREETAESQPVKQQAKRVPVEENQPEVPEVEQPVKRGRGRPRKTPVNSVATEEEPKKKRGRPKKVVEEEEMSFPGFEQQEQISMPEVIPEKKQEKVAFPGFVEEEQEKEEPILPGFESDEDEPILPGFESDEASIENTRTTEFEDEKEEPILPGFENEEEETNEPIRRTVERNQEPIRPVQPPRRDEVAQIDISPLLGGNKKIAAFLGTSKNGTSFIVNHVAEILSSSGVPTAILDTTQNKNSYYIYTNNDEALRNTAANCIDNLIAGQANGIPVNRNLTVYVPVPGEENQMHRAGEILKTLVQNYAVVLIDCDYETPKSYFAYTQELYLVQTLDILTIQPLTAFLNELKSRQILEEHKLRIVLNKFERLRGINDKMIIGGMSSYNDPGMSYMVDLFDKNLIKYIAVPFDEQIYVRYLEWIINVKGLTNMELSLKGYPKNMVQILSELANMVYPIGIAKPKGKGKDGGKYQPPALNNNNGFTPSINSTLEQMRKY